MMLSIVTTLFESSPYILEFYERVVKVVDQSFDSEYEIIFVNDGSPDNSLEIAVKLSENNPNVIVVDLSRNFGHHKAMMTGLSHSTGDLVFLIDSDLEESPELLIAFFEKMQRLNCDVVYGVQKTRKGGIIEKWSGEWFYSLFKLITGLALPRNIVTARLMSRRYVNALVSHQEREVFMAGLWFITGFDQQSLVVNKLNTSKTTYTLRKKLSILVNSITSFSNAPLVNIFYVGITISFFSLIYISYLVINILFFSNPMSGWTSVMASIWLLGGMVISFIGVVGIYLSKIFSESKQRPYTIVRKVYAKSKL